MVETQLRNNGNRTRKNWLKQPKRKYETFRAKPKGCVIYMGVAKLKITCLVKYSILSFGQKKKKSKPVRPKKRALPRAGE